MGDDPFAYIRTVCLEVCGKTGGGLRDVSGKVLIHSLTDGTLDSPGEASSPSDLIDLAVSLAWLESC